MKKDASFYCQPTLYALFYPRLRAIAIEFGYALAIHGSMLRDFDLIAIPWECMPKSADKMICQMCEELGGILKPEIEKKLHGRTCYVIFLADDLYLDISVMPVSP